MSFEARNAIIATIVTNVVFFTFREDLRPNFYSVYNQSLKSMLFSMFSHVNEQHLFFNMLGLYSHGRGLFVETTSSTWKNPLSFLALYLGSGLGGFYGVSVVSSLHQQQWNQKIRKTRKSFQCSHWFCELLPGYNAMSQPIADTVTYFRNFGDVTNSFLYNAVPRLGASGAVFGLMGARLYTSITNSFWHDHNNMHDLDKLLMVVQVAEELYRVPLRIHQISWEDNIDHVGHAAGFLSGVIIAAMIQKISKTSWFSRFPRQNRQGRRLGAR